MSCSIRTIGAAVLVTGMTIPSVGARAAATAPQAGQAAQAKAAKDLHDGPWLGTWKRRSTNPNGGGTMVMKMWKEGDGIRYTIEVPGATTHMEAWVRFDGKPYPEKGNSSADHNIFERIDDHTLTLRDIKDGKETIRFHITYSPDGKTRTSVSTRVNDKGETVTSQPGIWDRIE